MELETGDSQDLNTGYTVSWERSHGTHRAALVEVIDHIVLGSDVAKGTRGETLAGDDPDGTKARSVRTPPTRRVCLFGPNTPK